MFLPSSDPDAEVPGRRESSAPAPTANATTTKTRISPLEERRPFVPSAASAADLALTDVSPRGLGKRSNASLSCCSSSVASVHLVVGSQLLERAGKPGIDGSDRNAEHVGDPGRREAEPIAKDDNDSALQR